MKAIRAPDFTNADASNEPLRIETSDGGAVVVPQ